MPWTLQIAIILHTYSKQSSLLALSIVVWLVLNNNLVLLIEYSSLFWSSLNWAFKRLEICGSISWLVFHRGVTPKSLEICELSCELCRLQQNRKRLLSIHNRREKPCYETSRHKTWKNALGARAWKGKSILCVFLTKVSLFRTSLCYLL